MKKGIGKTISIITVLTLIFQMLIPIIPELNIEVLAADETVEGTEEISRNYEIKEEETWDISANGDGSVVAKWTLKDRTLTISGTGKMKDWEYNAKEDWHNTKYTNAIENVVIGQGITSIGDKAFYECSRIVKIKIPEGVTSIGDRVFDGCSNLTEINIPENVISIAYYAFSECSSLTEINIPEGVTSIANSAFEGCSSLANINVDENNRSYTSENGILFNKDKTEILKYPEGKKDVSIYSIPEAVTSIGDGAFDGCSSLTEINIPEGVTNIGNSAFDGCSSLTEINIPEGVTSIGYQTFLGCSSLTKINIPEGVTSIGYYAFEGCSSLTQINIPDGVTKISRDAIPKNTIIYTKADSEGHRYAEEGEQGYVLNGEPTTISANYKIEDEETWDISTNGDGSVTAKWTLSNRTLTISGTGEMKEWEYSAKEDWHNTQYTEVIENVVIQHGVTSIGNSAFYGCSSVTEINIPEGITAIGDSTFQGCSNLTAINILEGITSIGNSAFRECSSLTEINIPESVTSIDVMTFFGASNLTSINVDENNGNYTSENGVLFNKDKTKILRYPEGKKDVSKYSIPESVTSIRGYAFHGCSGLTEINIPEGVTSIGDYAFEECSSLTKINIPEGVTSIGYEAFSRCSSLKGITITEKVTSIYDNAIPSSTIIYTKANSEGHRYAEENKQGYIIDDIGPESIITPNGGQNEQKEYSVKIEVKDNFEEVEVNESSLKYQWTQSIEQPSKESFTESFENGQTIIKNTGDGEWYLWIYAKDNLGNETITRSESFKFDNTAPTLNVTYSTQALTNENVKVTITANEKVQEVSGWTLSSDGLKLTKTYSQNANEKVTVKDLAGNTKEANIQISNIDKTAPTLNVTYSTQNLTREDVTVTITANEKIQAVSGWTLSSDELKLTKTYSQNTNEKVTVKDLAGNEVQANIEITNIDKTLPEITIGDINQDENIDITDLFLLKRHIIAGSREAWKLTGDSLVAADMNEDSNVDITDLLMLKRKVIDSI